MSLVISINHKKEKFSPTPGQTLGQILEKACQKYKLDPDQYILENARGIVVDKAITYRLANLPKGTTLEAKKKTISQQNVKPSEVRIAIQLNSGGRLQYSYPSTTTLWEILKDCESKSNGALNLTNLYDPISSAENKRKRDDVRYMQCTVNILNLLIDDNLKLMTTSLRSLGMQDSGVIRINFKKTEKTEDFVTKEIEEIKQNLQKKSEEEEQQRLQLEERRKEQLKVKEEQAKKDQEEKAKKELELRKAREEKAKQLKEEEQKKLEETQNVPRKKDKGKEKIDEDEVESVVPQKEIKKVVQEEKPFAFPPIVKEPNSNFFMTPVVPQQEIKEVVPEEKPFAFPPLVKETNSNLVVTPVLPEKEIKENKPQEYEKNEKTNEESNQPTKKVIERDTKVFPPSDKPFNPAQFEVTDDFYEPDSELLGEVMRAQTQQAKQKSIENGVLRTKKMRELDRLKKIPNYSKSLIRIRFPNRIELQGNFHIGETIVQIDQFVKDNLKHPDIPFYLFTAPPKMRVEKGKTLKQLVFVPACIMHFSWEDAEKGPKEYLKDELMKDMKVDSLAVTDFPKSTTPNASTSSSVGSTTSNVQNSRAGDVKRNTNPQDKKVPSWFQRGKK